MQAYQAGQADSCAYFLMEAAKGYAQTQQWDSAAWCYNYVLYVYNSQESFLESIRLGQQGLAMLPKTGYLFVRMAMMMAYAQEKEGRLVAAYDTYEQAYLTCIKEQHYDATLGSFLYRPLATLATRFGEYERAKGLLQEWLFQLQETNQNEAIQQEAISNLSIVWLSLEQPDSALVLINEALRLKEGTPLTRGQIYTRLAEAQLAIQNFKEGTEAAQTATRLLQGVPPEEATWQLHNRVAYASAAWLVTGELFEAQLEEDMANQAYLNALSLHDQLPTKVPDRQRAKILVKIARLTHKQGELDVGKKYYQAALASLTGQVGLSALDSTTVFAENTFYEVLPGLARVYEQEQQYDSARWALRWGLV
ncbi:MAG TPA: hypothetical protein DCE41_04510, partial [Cytophagales bacterium]|nr:hypothetical protein [Cytophagales bacterium]